MSKYFLQNANIIRIKDACSLCPERFAITRTRQHTSKSIYMYDSNKYYKHCIVRAKIVFTIILIINFLIIFDKNLHNKNLHNNKLHNGVKTRVHFLKY